MRTILVVDDEKVFRKKYRGLLKEKGFKVKTASSALEVSEVLMRDKSLIDLILLDINIPEVDGRGIWEIIDEYAPQLQIIVTSVNPLHDQKIRIPRAADYYNKADKEATLLKKITRVLGVEKVQQP